MILNWKIKSYIFRGDSITTKNLEFRDPFIGISRWSAPKIINIPMNNIHDMKPITKQPLKLSHNSTLYQKLIHLSKLYDWVRDWSTHWQNTRCEYKILPKQFTNKFTCNFPGNTLLCKYCFTNNLYFFGLQSLTMTCIHFLLCCMYILYFVAHSIFYFIEYESMCCVTWECASIGLCFIL